MLCAMISLHFSVSAQDVIEIVDPYEMKASRSKEADTFYFTQNTNAILKKKLDTLRTYDVFLEEKLTPFGKAYMCNGNEVTKQKYLEFKRFWGASAACTPCLLYTYNDKNELKYVAYQYEECLCGSYKEYYTDGTLKVEGQFKQNTTGSWENLKSKNVCNVRDGIWIYYTETAVEEKRETYIDGKLKGTTFSPSQTSPVKQQAAKQIEDSTQTNEPKKNWFKKLKDKNTDEQ